MPRETRSRGMPAPSRVYHSTPTLQQVQFPSRRKKIRRFDEPDNGPTPSLKQQTLTQIDFVSSFEEDGDDVARLSDSEDDIRYMHHDKENMRPGELELEVSHIDGEDDAKEVQGVDNDDDEPVASNRNRAHVKTAGKKRRQTLGDANENKRVKLEKATNRRKTLGDAPASSNYHTQTLTQFLGHQTSFVADSDDDDVNDNFGLDNDEDDRFLSWLGQPGSPSAGRGRHNHSSPAMKQRHDAAAAAARNEGNGNAMSREDSVIPQTPAKRNTTIRFEVPSGGIHSTPPFSLIDRYGPPDIQDSPLKNRSSPLRAAPTEFTGTATAGQTTPSKPNRPSLVIQDSYVSESWDSPNKSQFRSPGGSIDEASVTTTPMKRLATVEESPSASASATPIITMVTPQKTKASKTPSSEKAAGMVCGRDEIPDSDDDDDGEGGFDAEVDTGLNDNDADTQGAFIARAETQLVMSEIAGSGQTQRPSAATQRSSSEPTVGPEESQPGYSSTMLTTSYSHGQSTTPSSNPQNQSAPSSTPKQTDAGSKAQPIRVPLQHQPSAQTQTQSQPYESQRVPVSILHSLPSPSARSDIILPISRTSLDELVTGHQVHVATTFKIPTQVARFWLLEGSLLRYMACVEPPGQQTGDQWQYYVSQVYELNNPMQEEDMHEERWIHGQIARYAYLPPAVIGQLLWNLRHAVFIDGSLEEQQHHQQHEVITATTWKQHLRDEAHMDLQSGPELPPPPPENATPPGSMSVSQQITAQIRSDIATSTQFPTSDDLLVPSTPEDSQQVRTYMQTPTPNNTTALAPPPMPPPHHPQSSASRTPSASKFNSNSNSNNIHTQNAIRPSQATTVSQTSTPEKRTNNTQGPGSISSSRFQEPATAAPVPLPPQFGHKDSSSHGSIAFLDHCLPLGSIHLPSSLSSASQLLSKSQMLSDSLIRDHAPPTQPPEIWDSDGEDAAF